MGCQSLTFITRTIWRHCATFTNEVRTILSPIYRGEYCVYFHVVDHSKSNLLWGSVFILMLKGLEMFNKARINWKCCILVVVSKGTTFKSKPIRLRTRNGAWLTVETEWSSFANPWSHRLEFIIGQHRVIK